MDIKNDGLSHEIIKEALAITKDARYAILDEIMLPCISKPRPDVADTAPKMVKMKIDVDKIREVIGSGGKVIQKICADTGAKIDIEDDGTIYIAGTDKASCDAAKKTIETIVFVPEVGQLYYGKVVRILQFGAFVELAPGKDGMVHISKLADRRVEKVEDVVNIGDMIWVKVTDIDEKGRVNLSYKDALKEIKAKKEACEPVKKERIRHKKGRTEPFRPALLLCKSIANLPMRRLQRHGHKMTARGPVRPTCANTSCA